MGALIAKLALLAPAGTVTLTRNELAARVGYEKLRDAEIVRIQLPAGVDRHLADFLRVVVDAHERGGIIRDARAIAGERHAAQQRAR